MTSNVRIVHNRLLGGWFIVRGPHQTPLSGRFDTKEEAKASLSRPRPGPRRPPPPGRPRASAPACGG